jgi:xylulokinase
MPLAPCCSIWRATNGPRTSPEPSGCVSTSCLPAIRPSAEIVGPLLPAAAEHLGLRPGLPVAIGAADTAASLLAAHLPSPTPRPPSLSPSSLPPLSPSPPMSPSPPPSGPPAEPWGLLTLGTGGQLIVPLTPNPDIPFSDNPDRGSAAVSGTTNLFRSVDGGTYRLAGAQNVGVTLDWVRRTLGASWDELYATAARPWRADTPVFLPYLAGERWDHRDTGGAWTGLTLAHQREDLMRAALEGVAFLLRGKLDDLRAYHTPSLAAIRLAGGGSRPPAWRQLLADALGVPLYPAGDGWLTARGAALIAAVATGLGPDADTTGRSDRNAEAVVPASQLAEQAYRRFASVSDNRGLGP